MAREYYCLDEYTPELTQTELGWGMLPRLDYAVIFEKTILNQCARRLEPYGVDVETLWTNTRKSLLASATPS